MTLSPAQFADDSIDDHGRSQLNDRGVIINADDWGRDVVTTDRTLDCILLGSVSSASAMVFMEDSERAADLALQRSVDIGLHLNCTTKFSSKRCATRLLQHQQKLARFLRSSRLAPIFYHPVLASSFEYVVKSQIDEFVKLYGNSPRRIDGHHHMHLCTNVVSQRLLPSKTIVRRNFSFRPGEKSRLNRAYRRWQDHRLALRHSTTDLFFSLPPLLPVSRLEEIFNSASSLIVEIETHPVNEEEYKFLTSEEIFRLTRQTGIARGYSTRLFHGGGRSRA